MPVMEVKEVNFSYPDGNKILQDINLTIEAGAFIILCGPSGCGKTTLLRTMKEQIAPEGTREGFVSRLPADEIGFVFQNPDTQIVTDTVRHELAFGLENMGLPAATIRRRIAETALFFGIDEWIDASVHEISGGQKQLLNLAAVIAMRPKLLLLDEPVSQLDPSARKNFLDILVRVNRELGIAVFISEHHLEEILSLADEVLFMKSGKIVFRGNAKQYTAYILTAEPDFSGALPASARIAYALGGESSNLPLTVREGRSFLEDQKMMQGKIEQEALRAFFSHQSQEVEPPLCLYVDHIWYQYQKQFPFVLKGLELKIRKNEYHMILGGNGSGKTTLLSVLGKRIFANRGRIKLGKDKKAPRTALLTQNPKAMFSYDTVREELNAAAVSDGLTEQLRLTQLKEHHPYDISGGEQQRLGLAIVLAQEPELLLLDEPTKGLDIAAKDEIGRYLRQYARSGHAVIGVTHDVEFAAAYADVCSLLFEGEILSTETAAQFFSDNAFYTTDAVRILKGFAAEF